MTIDEIKAAALTSADASAWMHPLDAAKIDPRTIKARHVRTDGQCTSFVARSTQRGRSWLRFLHKLDPQPPERWWVSAHKTRREALESD